MIDLFAGCGGATTGLEQSGFEPVLVSEKSKDALDTYLLNRTNYVGEIEFKKQTDLHVSDIAEITEEKLNQIRILLLSRTGKDIIGRNGEDANLDLIVGGPPCQGYSTIGHRRTYNVERKFNPQNKLYEKMAQLIGIIRPKSFLFENVRGLLTAKWSVNGEKGEIWNDVLRSFQGIKGYHVRWSLIESKKFGIPQNRPRVILIGIRGDCINSDYINLKNAEECAIECGLIPNVDKRAPNLEDLLSDLVDDSILENLSSQNYPECFTTAVYKKDPLTECQQEMRTQLNGAVLKSGDILRDQEYSKHSKKVYDRFKYMLDNNGIIQKGMKTKKFSQRLLPKEWSEIGPTITATSLPDDYVHYSQPRTLTVRELSRIQTFPDWYQFCGPRTTGSLNRAGSPTDPNIERILPKYTQIGNAIPVKLAKELGLYWKKVIYGI